MLKNSNALPAVLATNLALVIVSIILGLIVSCVAQLFMFSGKKVFELTHNVSDYNFLNFTLFDEQFNFIPLIISIIAALLIGILIS